MKSRQDYYLLIGILFCSMILCLCDKPSDCASKQTCSDCIRQDCAWCSKNLTNDEPFLRCNDKNQTTSDWCPENDLVKFSSTYKVIKNEELSAGKSSEHAVQIKPQHIKLSLALGEKVEFPIYFQQAEDYPIDLYFLMDLSVSMDDDRENLSLLGEKLSVMMKNISNNFRLGFGSFVDKPEMPFTNTKPEALRSPCKDRYGNRCDPPYSFKNNMPLNENSNLFKTEVKKAPLSGNLDTPEGGFDGLIQAMVCTKEIGWREKSRKLLVFSTDALPHIAGDGKLLGIVEPNDEQCHLDAKGFYTNSLATDYPSIAQIDYQARKNNINIIFAVTNSQKEVYKLIKNGIHGASYGVLKGDSSNVVDLVKSEYDKIVNSLSLMDNADGSVKIEYSTPCMGGKATSTNKCDKLKGRPKVPFTITVTALDCPKDESQWTKTIEIKPEALNEVITIELTVHCQCPCESGEKTQKKSPECKGHGDLQCGVCVCDPGRYGKVCECDGDAASTVSDDVSQCKPNDTVKEICFGRGFCKCGKCDCIAGPKADQAVYGKYCECDNYSCERHLGLLCSGPEKGSCVCGQCVCQPGWGGKACECKQTNVGCIAPGETAVCSGNGTCVCGVCSCHATETFRYSGLYCEQCPHCSTTKCDELKDCVECQVHKTGKYSGDECMLKCTAFQTEIVERLNNETDGTVCKVPDDGECTVDFKYSYREDQSLYVQGQKEKECSKETDIALVIIGVVAATVIGGLILLVIWKIMTTVHDSREYAKFVNETQNAQFGGENPLYTPSTSTFRNPMFNRKH